MEGETAPVEVRGLRKRYKTLNRREGLAGAFKDLLSRDYKYTDAVDGIDFSIGEGEMVGFVGPNGAGKSTTIKILTGVLQPSGGTALVNGLEPFKNRTRNASNIGVVFGQRSQLWWDLPLVESFKVLKEIYRIPDADYDRTIAAFDELVGIKDLFGKQVRTMSLGQRMLADIAAAFLHDPRIIFLDEPTIGLDVSVKARIWSLVLELNRRRRTTIVLTTHDIADIEALCKRILIIDKGKIIYDGDLSRVSGIVGAYRTLRLSFGQSSDRDYGPELERDLRARFPEEGALGFEAGEDGWFAVTIKEDRVRLMDVLNAITGGYPVKDVQIEEIKTEHVIKKIYEGALS